MFLRGFTFGTHDERLNLQNLILNTANRSLKPQIHKKKYTAQQTQYDDVDPLDYLIDQSVNSPAQFFCVSVP